MGDGDEGFREREAIYPLSEGLTSRRLGQFAHEAVERAPDLPEWIEPGLKARSTNGPIGAMRWRGCMHDPADAKARERLAYDELFANQLAFMLVRASSRARRGRALAGDGRLRDLLKLPYAPTGAQARTISEIEGDLAQSVADAAGCSRAMSDRARRWSRRWRY